MRGEYGVLRNGRWLAFSKNVDKTDIPVRLKAESARINIQPYRILKKAYQIESTKDA